MIIGLNRVSAYLAAILLILAIDFSSAFAQSPKEKLLGYWSFKRGLGGPCASLIKNLEYSFDKKGRYYGKAKMSNGAVFEYNGTFSATDTECTTFVNGVTVGPYPYTIEGEVLTVSQPEYNCKVQLIREDY